MPSNQPVVAVPVGRPAEGPDPKSRPDASSSSPSSPPDQPRPGSLTPPIDIYEEAGGLVLEADLPGVSDDRLTVQLQSNVLVIRGEMAPAPLDPPRLLHEEYRPGDYWRSFILSDEVDRSRISATLRNGVLRVVLPRAERAVARRIEVQSS